MKIFNSYRGSLAGSYTHYFSKRVITNCVDARKTPKSKRCKLAKPRTFCIDARKPINPKNVTSFIWGKRDNLKFDRKKSKPELTGRNQGTMQPDKMKKNEFEFSFSWFPGLLLDKKLTKNV